jgi:hypothetical protein
MTLEISQETINKAKDFLKNKSMFKEITEDEFEKVIVGEVNTRKAVFLQNCSTWVKGVVSHTLVGGESSAGKDYVTGNVLKIFPVERIITRTKITPQAFTYWHEGENDWTWEDKIVYLPDVSDNLINSPVFKCMATEGTFATVVRNGKSEDIEIRGIPNLIVTTAEANPTNEILNRFSLVSLDESEDQTLAIMEFEAQKSINNKKYFYRSDIVQALRLLEQVEVVVPYADKMVEFFPKSVKLRRIFRNFLSLIKNSAALHQFQRVKTAKGEVVADEQDYEIAREVIENIREQTISGVTAKERRYIEKFVEALEKTKQEWLSVAEIHTETGYKSLQTWWDVVKQLENKNLIEGKEFEEVGSFKPTRKYRLKEMPETDKLKLPAFAKLGANKYNK